MRINDIITTGANLTVAVGINELREWHQEVIENARSELEQAVKYQKNESYLTPKQVSEMLNVNLATLWRWAKKNYLSPIEIGGKRRYKLSDINNLLKQ